MRRNVLLIDSGEYRNDPTRHMHDVIGTDGKLQTLASGKRECRIVKICREKPWTLTNLARRKPGIFPVQGSWSTRILPVGDVD